MKTVRLLLICLCSFSAINHASSAVHSIARDWDEQCLSAVRLDRPHPPVQARNLFSLSVCMYDAWAAYDTNGPVGFIYHGKHTAGDIAAARREAISYAAYRILRQRYSLSIQASNTLPALDLFMQHTNGYSTNNFSTDTSTPAGVGNSVFLAVSNWFILDGARELQAYADYPTNQGGYIYINPALASNLPGITDGSNHTVVDINRWQRLLVANAFDQGGHPIGSLQNYLGPQWLGVRPFALTRTDSSQPWIDFGPPPYFGTASDAAFRSNVVEVIRRGSELTPDDGVTIDSSPGAFGNNTLGMNDGHGHTNNPVTHQPYATNIVKRGDFARVLAEFWADGPNSETPPGHWNVLANNVSDYPGFEKRIGGGTNAVVDDLEWDVKVYFALNAAVHDAACAAWSAKRYYDAWRPLSAIRYMGLYGQSSDSGAPSYHPNGLPLITNLIELTTPASVVSGGRHYEPSNPLPPNRVVIRAWPGQPANPSTQYSGVHWLEPTNWITYQKKTFVTPAFPGYISGHSTFSRSAAEIMAAITGSAFFPGGMATFTAPANSFLTFEKGPSQTIQLQWATYYDAADQAGLSRIWGGIHPPIDDVTGRRAGSQCGQAVWALAQKYFDGSVTNVPVTLTMRRLNAAQCEVRFNTLRGLYYKQQATSDLNQSFADDGGGFAQALESSIARTNSFADPGKFFRVISALAP